MRRLFTTCALMACTFIATASFADNADPYTLHMTLVNNTDTNLTFMGAKNQNVGNVFSITAPIIAPHASAVITGIITQDTDLAANLHFRDSQGGDNVLIVIDPRNIHIVQPVFSMRNKTLHSIVKSKKQGDVSMPRGLYIAESTVEIEYNVL